jgi:hypothetical protein
MNSDTTLFCEFFFDVRLESGGSSKRHIHLNPISHSDTKVLCILNNTRQSCSIIYKIIYLIHTTHPVQCIRRIQDGTFSAKLNPNVPIHHKKPQPQSLPIDLSFIHSLLGSHFVLPTYNKVEICFPDEKAGCGFFLTKVHFHPLCNSANCTHSLPFHFFIWSNLTWYNCDYCHTMYNNNTSLFPLLIDALKLSSGGSLACTNEPAVYLH